MLASCCTKTHDSSGLPDFEQVTFRVGYIVLPDAPVDVIVETRTGRGDSNQCT